MSLARASRWEGEKVVGCEKMRQRGMLDMDLSWLLRAWIMLVVDGERN
jgi:hypothetical protein